MKGELVGTFWENCWGNCWENGWGNFSENWWGTFEFGKPFFYNFGCFQLFFLWGVVTYVVHPGLPFVCFFSFFFLVSRFNLL